MLTYIPPNPNDWICSENGIAVEYGFLSVFTNKEALEKHLHELVDDGRIATRVSVARVSIEDVLRTADEKNKNVWFDITDELNRGYYMYDAKERELKVVILSR